MSFRVESDSLGMAEYRCTPLVAPMPCPQCGSIRTIKFEEWGDAEGKRKNNRLVKRLSVFERIKRLFT